MDPKTLVSKEEIAELKDLFKSASEGNKEALTTLAAEAMEAAALRVVVAEAAETVQIAQAEALMELSETLPRAGLMDAGKLLRDD